MRFSKWVMMTVELQGEFQGDALAQRESLSCEVKLLLGCRAVVVGRRSSCGANEVTRHILNVIDEVENFVSSKKLVELVRLGFGSNEESRADDVVDYLMKYVFHRTMLFSLECCSHGRMILGIMCGKGVLKYMRAFTCENSNCEDRSSLGAVAIQKMLLTIPKTKEVRQYQFLNTGREHNSAELYI